MKNKLLNRNKVTQLFSLLTFLLLFANTAVGQRNIAFTGVTDSDWSTASNWNYPAITSVATYANTSATVTLAVASNDIAVGDAISGAGIPAGATISAINGTNTVVTISANTTAAGTNVNVVFTFATPKIWGVVPGSTDIALINSNATTFAPTISSGTVTVVGLTVTNTFGTTSGATLTINSGVILNISSTSHSNLILSGGNIINNGTINISTSAVGSAGNIVYGINCTAPVQTPSSETEYGISGTGALNITLSGANFSGAGAIVTTGTTSVNPTYKIAVNGTIVLNQSTTLSIAAIRAGGGTTANKLIITGAGFTVGTVGSPSRGALLVLGNGCDITVDTGTTLTFNSASANTLAGISLFSSSATATNFTNKGAINFVGSSASHGISYSTGVTTNTVVYNIINQGILNINLNCTTVATAPMFSGNGGGRASGVGSGLFLNNTGTFTLKNTSTATGTGSAILVSSAGEAPPINIINGTLGTVNFEGSCNNSGSKASITNNGVINSNSDFITFTAITNNASGTFNFVRTASTGTTKQVTFVVLGTAVASNGATYSDGTNTFVITNPKFNFAVPNPMITNVLSTAVIAATGTLTKVSGTGDNTIAYTSFSTSLTNSAVTSAITSSGTINTDTGANLSVLAGLLVASTGVVDPGGLSGRGIASFSNGSTLAINSTLRLQISGNTTAGVDFDRITNSATGGGFNIAGAKLDVTITYIPPADTTIDIITTNATGTLSGDFNQIVTALPSGWAVNVIPGGSGTGKVQLVYTAPAAGTITSVASGPWSDGATWVGGIAPTAVDNVIIGSNHIVTISTAITRNVGTTTTVDSGGTLATNLEYTNSGTTTINGTFQLNAGGFTSGNNFVYRSGSTLNFNNTASYGVNNTDQYWPTTSGPSNVSVLQGGMTLNSGANRTVQGTFQTSAAITLTSATLTLNGTVRINTGGFFVNAPIYGSASTLVYNTGATFTRGNEWTTATSGAGYPANVQVANPGTVTTVDMGATTAQCSGSITVNASTVLNTTSGGLTVLGSVTTNGTIFLGGDVTLSSITGNWTVGSAGVQNNNGKAVFFTGATGNQTITKTGGGVVFFDYLVINKLTSGSVLLSSSPATSVTINTTTGDVLQILGAGSLNLQSQTLTLANNGGNILVTGAARSITSTAAGATLAITGTKAFNGTGTLAIAANVTTVLSAGFDFGVSKVTVNGTLQLNSGGFASNGSAPIYASGSTLLFNTGGFYDMHNGTADAAGWYRNTASTGSAQAGVPWHVTISNNTSVRYNAASDDNNPRYINGNLIINTGSAFTLGGLSGTAGDFYLRGNWNKSATGTFTPNSRLVSFNGTAAQTLTNATTFDFLTLSNTAGLTLQASSPITVNQALAVISGATLNNGGNAVTISSAGNSSVAGIIAGTGTLVKTGAGTLTLTAASGNNTANTYTGATTISAASSGSINVTGLTNITSTAIAQTTQVVAFSTTTPANGTYKLLPGALTVGTQSFSHNADDTKIVTFNYTTSTITVASQALTAYRTVNSGDWTDLDIWQKWNGTAWVKPTALEGYPCQNAPASIYILNSHNVTCGIGVTGTNRATRIEINAGASNTSLTFTGSSYFELNGANVVLNSTGSGNALLDVGSANIYSFGTLTINKSIGGGINKVLINSGGILNFGTNITMGGLAAETFIEFTGSGTLVSSGGTITGGTIIAGTGTVDYRAGANQTVGTYTYNNLTLSNRNVASNASYTKTLTSGTIINGNLTISESTGPSTVASTIASLNAGSTYNVNSLILGTTGKAGGTWGYDATSGATNFDTTYFANTTGKVNVASSTPDITINIGSYTYIGSPVGPNSVTTASTGVVTYSYVGVPASSYTASATRPTNAGNYTVTATVAADGGFASRTSAATAFTIATAALTITANNATKIIDTTYTVGSSTAFTSSGLQGIETIGSITIASTGAVNTAAEGSYTITPSAATGGTFIASNYTITYNITTPGLLTVNPNAGDYRTRANGDWTTLATWQRWNGTSWAIPTVGEGYPIQTADVTRLEILNGHNVTCGIGTGSNLVGRMTISAGANNTSLTFTSGYYFAMQGNAPLVLTSTGAGNALIDFGNANFYSFHQLLMTNSSTGTCKAIINSGTPTFAGNITMSGTASQNIIQFDGPGTLTCGAALSGGTISAGIGTVRYTANAAQSVGAYTFNNLTLSNSNTTTNTSYIKTLNAGTVINGNLTISGSTGTTTVATTIARLPTGSNYTIPSLVFDTAGQIAATYGSTQSSSSVKNDTYLDNVTASSAGIITVATNIPVVSPTIGSYTYTGLAQGPIATTNSGTGTLYTYSYANNGGTNYGPSSTPPTNAGNYFVTVTVGASAPWEANSSGAKGFRIAPRSLIITANNSTKQFGATHPTGAATGPSVYTAATLQSVDTIGSITIESTGAVNTAPVSTYDIVPSLATGGTFNPSNYTISYVNGTLTVSNATTGDYRSVASTNWSSLTTWERWSGSAWVTPDTASPEGWPGQYAVASRVYISDDTTVTADVSIFGTNRPTRLEFTPDANNAVLNINSGVSLGIDGNVVIAATGLGANTGDAILNVGSGSLPIQGLLRLNDTQGSSNDCILRIGTGSVSVSGTDARMLGAADENLIVFDGAGTLSTLGGTTIALAGNGTFTAGTGTVIFNGAAQTVGSYAFYNLTLKGSGIKTVSAAATIAGNLTIDDTATASLSPDITYSVSTLTLGCRETENGTWGSGDADVDYADDDYFQPTNGKINVSLDKSLKLPVTSGPQPTCENPTVTITVAEQYPNQMYSFDNGTSWQVSNVSTPLPFGTYAVLIQNSRGCSTSPVKIVILVTPTKTWIGTAGAGGSNWTNGDNWSPSGVPAPTNCISIPDVLTNDLIIDGDITASLYSLTVGSGGSVTVNSGSSLKITDFINVDPAGTLTVQNNANLVQVNNATNTGNILYNRATPPLLETDYTYWSSPVVGQTLTAISPVNYPEPGSYFYSFNNSTDQWSSPLSGSTVMLPGVGYIMRGQNILGPNIAATFTGVPRNGPQIVQSLSTSNSLLIGNPYPSAIDADLFLDFNKDFIEGTIYFWTHRTPITNLVYSADDYASYNFTGGVGTGTASASLSSVPTGKIAATQGFFATSKAVGDVTFNNSMRLDGSGVPFNNSNFYKTANSQKPNAFEKHRVWLDLTNTQGAFKQMLVGYITNATNEYDSAFDGKSFDGNEFVDFYSINENKNLTIQGRAVPFNENDAVPLGFRSKLSGEFSINIHKVDGVLTNQDIVIEDKLTNTFVNLKNGSFTFSTVAGTFNNRFVLRFKDKTLGTNDLSGHTSKILISVKNKQIKINSFAENIDKVAIYDLLGRQIYQKTKVSDNELILSNFASSNQTLLVKTTLENGITVTEKVIY